MKKIGVIGGGFSGLSSACYLAKHGYDVTLYERHDQLGGRARTFETDGFVFDMGPSWYWMPDVFERFYSDFGHTTSDFYELVELDPGFQIVFEGGETIPIPRDMQSLEAIFESKESGSAKYLRKFLAEAKLKYEVSMNDIVFKPSYSFLEYIRWPIIKRVLQVDFFRPMRSSLAKYFKHPQILKIMEFPVLFLGAMADKIPALYSIMNHAALAQGTYYPIGGMHQIVKAMTQIATENGVKIILKSDVNQLLINNGRVVGIQSNGEIEKFDAVVASADYEWVERNLLSPEYRNYSESYWTSRVLAPSCLLFYIGVKTRLPKLTHHTLFFDTDFELHSHEIYTYPKWPTDPLFYVCAPSITDSSVAPPESENLFILIPIAVGLEDTPQLREKYYHIVMKRLSKYCGINIDQHIVCKRDYAQSDFVSDYRSYKGNAYGLANTLMQTGPLKPSLRNRHLPNLYYTGQLTVPGPGVPPSLISGKIVATEIHKFFNNK